VASGADVAPTILDLLGVEGPDGMDGLSMVPAMTAGERVERIAYSQTVLPRDEFGWSPLEGARDARWARVVGPIPELYDLDADPGQANNLGGTEPDVSRRLDDFIASVRSSARRESTRTMGADEIEALRSLGYVLSGSAPEFTGADPKERIAEWQRVNEAREALSRGDLRRALSITDDVLRAEPGNHKARGVRGQTLVRLGRADEGIEDLRRVFEATGSLDHDGTALARALAEAGRVDESERLLRGFIAAQPDYAEHSFNLGVLFASVGRPADAIAAYEEAARHNPNGIHILSNLAITLAREGGAPDRALELIDRAVELVEGDDRPRLLRLDVLHLLGRDDEAMEGVRELQSRERLRGVTSQELRDLLQRWQGEAAGGGAG
jgi:tetratricopeptide (TPR) repeat protein